MIVNLETKAYQTRSDMPNYNWLGEGWKVVPDGSDIANDIIKFYPRYELIIEDEEIIGVKEIPKTQEEINQEKVVEIDKELSEIDSKGLTRFIEDVIDFTKIYLLMPQTTKDLIDRKKELREERKKLV